MICDFDSYKVFTDFLDDDDDYYEKEEELMLEYNKLFALLLKLDTSHIYSSIEFDDFCDPQQSNDDDDDDNEQRKRRLQNDDNNDQRVTIQLSFGNNKKDAQSAKANVCNLITAQTIFSNSMLMDPNDNENNNNFIDSKQQCMADGCQYSMMDLQIKNKSSLRLLTLPSAFLPGYQFLSYSFNLFLGMPPTDLILEGYYRQIIDFTFDKEQVSSGSNDYLVPDQFDLPSIAPKCHQESATSSVSHSLSTSSMSREASEATGSNTFQGSVEASGWGFSVSASTAHSSSFSQSRQSSASRRAASSGKTQSTLYTTQLQWDEIDSFQDDFKDQLSRLSTSRLQSDIEKETMLFIGNYGTHVLDLARMGARCRKTTYYSSAMSSESYHHSSQSSYSSSEEESYSGSAGGGAFGFSASVSAAYADSSTRGNSRAISGSIEASTNVEYSSETVDCIGEVAVTSACGEMLGTQNQPALVGYRLKAIWDLPIFNNEIYYPNAKKNLLNGLKNIDQAAIKCGKQHCGGLGICAIKQSFWTLFKYKNWNSNSKYDDIWDPEICLNQYYFGHSLMKSGSNIRTQMNQCNSSDQVLWGERYESSVIRFDPFCVNKMQIAVGLIVIFNNTYYFSLFLM